MFNTNIAGFKIGDIGLNITLGGGGEFKVPKSYFAGDNEYQLENIATQGKAFLVTKNIEPEETPLIIPVTDETPVAAIPTAPYRATLSYANRPHIEIINAANKNLIRRFDSFFISGVQEIEAERFETIETFGAPHIFTSGRFTRKYTFSGHVRVYPVNEDGIRPQHQVSQNVMFREFYDQFLRASVQAQKGWYTKIVVDKEVYEGFVSTFNYNRDASVEGVIPFVFSFTGVRRTHTTQSGGDAVHAMVDRDGGPIDRGDVNTNIADVVYIQELLRFEEPSAVTPAIVNAGNITKTKPVASFTSGSHNNLLRITSSLPGLGLFIGGKNANGLMVGKGLMEMQMKVMDYFSLFKAITEQNKNHPGGATLPVSIAQFNIQTSKFGEKIPFTAQFTLPIPAQETGKVTQQLIYVNNNLYTMPMRNTYAYSSPNTITIKTRLYITSPTGLALNLTGSALALTNTRTTAVLGDSMYNVANTEDLLIADCDITNSVTNVQEEYVEVTTTAVLNSNGSTVNPFAEADGLLISYLPIVTLGNGNTVTAQPVKILITHGNSNAHNILTSLKFIDAVYNPLNINYDTGVHTQQIGVLNFVLKTTKPLNSALLLAIQQGSKLQITTQQGYINPIPLSLSVIANGEMQGVKVTARTLKFDGINLQIQICSNLKQKQIWESVLQSKSVSLIIKDGLGLQAPSPARIL